MLDFGFLCCWSPRATPFLLTECCRVLALRGQSTQPSSTRCILTLILIIPRLPVIPRPPRMNHPPAIYPHPAPGVQAPQRHDGLPIRRGWAGPTPRVNTAGNTKQHRVRPKARPKDTEPLAGMRAVSGGSSTDDGYRS